ncbi:MAG: cell division protein CrgA [Acidimicrobiia bacterium]|nr:MAG: cell division protein CrgA [Acidimicrobiia bacterium]
MPKSKGRRRPSRAITPPPVRKESKVSPTWYVVLMFSLMAVGVLVIILNYVDVMPGGQRSMFLYTGLASIAVGFMMTLNYH